MKKANVLILLGMLVVLSGCSNKSVGGNKDVTLQNDTETKSVLDEVIDENMSSDEELASDGKAPDKDKAETENSEKEDPDKGNLNKETEEAAGVTENKDAEGMAAGENYAIFKSYVNDDIKVNDKTFTERFSYVKEDFDQDPAVYTYDVDEDGEDELLVNTFYYGFDIFDVRDGELYLLAWGDGTAAVCNVYAGDGHTYVGHSDFTHAGRQYLTLERYDGTGQVVETLEINAEYWDEEDDTYKEDSDFSYNGQKITMQEYEKYMNTYSAVIDELKAFDADNISGEAMSDIDYVDKDTMLKMLSSFC